MTDYPSDSTAALIATVAREVARATLVAAGGIRSAVASTVTPTASTPVATAPRKPLTEADVTDADRAHFATCVHESSHATIGVALGAELRSAVAVGDQGRTDFYECPPGTVPRMTYSGVYGQAKFLAGGRRPTQRALFALFDAGGSCDRDSLSAAGDVHAGTDVQPLIDRTWPAILAVAGQLFRDGEVFEKDVLAALGVTDGGTRTSVQLAAIRSGCRSVPPITRKPRVPA